MNKGVSAYQNDGLANEIRSASPHRLIQILLEHALGEIIQAKNYINIGDIPGKCRAISRCMSMIISLRASLNKDLGGEIAYNLDRLYEFIENHLLKANIESSNEYLSEVESILRTIKEGWDGISPD
jgi:flagellar secretion chaperone FliS